MRAREKNLPILQYPLPVSHLLSYVRRRTSSEKSCRIRHFESTIDEVPNQMVVEAEQFISSSGSTKNNCSRSKNSQELKSSKILKKEDSNYCTSASNFENESCSRKITDQCQSTSGNIVNERDCRKLIRKNKSSKICTIEAIQAKVEIGNNISKRKSLTPWGRRYKELVSYVKEFGDTRVPQRYVKNPSLGNWVNTQRSNLKKVACSMTMEEIQLLNNIGFEWTIHSIVSWDHRYEELVNYVKEFGHACVSRNFATNPSLGPWVNQQRRIYKKFLNGNTSCSVTKDQIRLLDNIGFEWKINKQTLWDDRYGELGCYVKEFGHARVPRNFAKNQSLANWVLLQRNKYKKMQNGNLSYDITKK